MEINGFETENALFGETKSVSRAFSGVCVCCS